jgi:hypothetical protein
MKHIHTLLMTVLLSASASAAETEAPPPAPESRRTILGILFNPSQLGVLALQGERVVSPRVSVGLGVRAGILRAGGETRYSTPSGTDMESERSSYLVGVGPQARFFLTGTAPQGLWLSPQLDVTRSWGRFYSRGSPLAEWESETKTRGWSIGGTALLGYSTVVGKGLAVQIGAGVETRYERTRNADQHNPPSDSGLFWSDSMRRSRSWYVSERVALSLGWAF